jgi:hypothetical protein
MVDSNRNGKGRRRRRWAMAMAMATESATETEMATANEMAMATARATSTKEGLPVHVPAMCSAVAGATPCLHPHGHKGKCIYQRCVMEVTLLRVFAPFQGEGSRQLTMDSFFVNYLQLLFSLPNNPLFAPHIIQALKSPVSPLTLYFLHSSKNAVSLLTIYPGSYCTFCQGKPGRGLQ